MAIRFATHLAIACALCAASSASALDVGVTFRFVESSGASGVYAADLTGLGLSEVASITLEDNGAARGGALGIFSGFDVDALFLDSDGRLTTTGDQYHASRFDFQAGSTRATTGREMHPNAAHSGPTFGSLDATTIDHAVATLDSIDGVIPADVNIASGFLSLGDGGSLTAFFAPRVSIGKTLYLIAGEVGDNGEGLNAFVTISDGPAASLPEPTSALLFATGFLVAGRIKRR